MEGARAVPKEQKFLKIEAKKKKKADWRNAAKVTEDPSQVVQQSPLPVTLEEYIPFEWFRIVEEDDQEEEVLYSCKMTIIHMDFQESRVELEQDNRTRNNMIVSSYRQAKDRARVTLEILALD